MFNQHQLNEASQSYSLFLYDGSYNPEVEPGGYSQLDWPEASLPQLTPLRECNCTWMSLRGRSRSRPCLDSRVFWLQTQTPTLRRGYCELQGKAVGLIVTFKLMAQDHLVEESLFNLDS